MKSSTLMSWDIKYIKIKKFEQQKIKYFMLN
jgi:hypothetical protein